MISRNQRTTALTFGAMAEVALGGVLLVWSSSPSPLGREALGSAASIAVVAVAMVLFALALLFPRLARGVLVPIVSVAAAGLGVLAILVLMGDPGVGLMLGFGWALTLPVAAGIVRSRAT